MLIVLLIIIILAVVSLVVINKNIKITIKKTNETIEVFSDFKLEEGHIYVKALDIPSDYDSVVLKTMEVQLMTIEESNHKYVQIENL